MRMRHAIVFILWVSLHDGHALYPYGTSVGDNMLTEEMSSLIPLDPPLPFYDGQNHSTVMIYKDAFLTFDDTPRDIYMLAPGNDVTFPAVCVWASDISVTSDGGRGAIYYRLATDLTTMTLLATLARNYSGFSETFIPSYALIVTWDAVTPPRSTRNKTNTFQAVLASDGAVSLAIMMFNTIEWIYDGNEIIYDDYDIDTIPFVRAQVGFYKGDGVTKHLLPSSFDNDIQYIGTDTNANQDGAYVYRIDIAPMNLTTALTTTTATLSPSTATTVTPTTSTTSSSSSLSSTTTTATTTTTSTTPLILSNTPEATTTTITTTTTTSRPSSTTTGATLTTDPGPASATPNATSKTTATTTTPTTSISTLPTETTTNLSNVTGESTTTPNSTISTSTPANTNTQTTTYYPPAFSNPSPSISFPTVDMQVVSSQFPSLTPSTFPFPPSSSTTQPATSSTTATAAAATTTTIPTTTTTNSASTATTASASPPATTGTVSSTQPSTPSRTTTTTTTVGTVPIDTPSSTPTITSVPSSMSGTATTSTSPQRTRTPTSSPPPAISDQLKSGDVKKTDVIISVSVACVALVVAVTIGFLICWRQGNRAGVISPGASSPPKSPQLPPIPPVIKIPRVTPSNIKNINGYHANGITDPTSSYFKNGVNGNHTNGFTSSTNGYHMNGVTSSSSGYQTNGGSSPTNGYQMNGFPPIATLFNMNKNSSQPNGYSGNQKLFEQAADYNTRKHNITDGYHRSQFLTHSNIQPFRETKFNGGGHSTDTERSYRDDILSDYT